MEYICQTVDTARLGGLFDLPAALRGYQQLEVTIRPPPADRGSGRKAVTRKLNEVYAGNYYKEFELIADAALESLRKLTKDDAW
jgi:hypothetical protein